MKTERIRNRIKAWTAAALCALLAAVCMQAAAAEVNAYPPLNPSAAVALTVKAVSPEGDIPISSLEITLYRAADMAISESGAASFELTEAFKSFNGQINGIPDPNKMDSSSWADGAKTFARYLPGGLADGTTFETFTRVTGEDGAARFTDLRQGLYLMISSYKGTQFEYASIVPSFLTLPQLSEDGASWIYDASITGKPEVGPATTEETSVTVRKVWEGESASGASSSRPGSITVVLHDADGDPLDTQILSASNGWTFSWAGLEAGEYFVTESDIPSGYTVSLEEQVTEDGKLVTVTNTAPINGESQEDTPTPTPTPVNPSPGTPNAGPEGDSPNSTPNQGVLGENRGTVNSGPEGESINSPANQGVAGESREKQKEADVKGESREKKEAAVASEHRLPQTGQLWWPVWLLSAIAAVLMIFGMLLRVSGRSDLRDR